MFFFNQPDDVKAEIEAKEELAKNRLLELEKLKDAHKTLTVEYERMKQQVSIKQSSCWETPECSNERIWFSIESR